MQLTKNKIYPWVMIACCCLLATASIGIAVNCMGVYYASIAEELNVGLGQVSVYLTILNLTCGLCGPLVIALTKKVNIRIVLAVGGLGTAVSYVALANANALWQIYALALIQGVLTAMSGMVIVTTLVSNWFNKAMGIAAGISLSFSGLMGAVLSPVFSSIIQSSGWRTSYYVAAAAVVVCVVPALIVVRLHPAELNIPRYGDSTVTQPAVPAAGEKKKDTDIFRAVPFYMLAASSVFAAFISGFGTHAANMASSVGLTPEVGALMVSAVMVGNMTSKLVSGVLCDVFGPRRAVTLIFGCSALGCLGMVFVHHPIAMFVCCFLLGTSYSICGVGLSTMARDIFGATRFSSAYSYMTTAGFAGSAVAFSLIGFSFDLFHTFSPALIFCTVICTLSMLFIQIAYRKSKKAG